LKGFFIEGLQKLFERFNINHNNNPAIVEILSIQGKPFTELFFQNGYPAHPDPCILSKCKQVLDIGARGKAGTGRRSWCVN
jgi:hypothetical protein